MFFIMCLLFMYSIMLVFNVFFVDDVLGLPPGWEQNGSSSLGADDDIIALLVKHAGLQLTQEESDELLLQARVRNTHDWRTFLQTLLNQEVRL